jgi:hypothetical protein
MQYEDRGLAEGARYCYVVKAVNKIGAAESSEACGATKLSAPTGLSVSAASATSLAIGWTDTAKAETAYQLQRQDDGGAWKDVKSYGALSGTTRYTNSGLAAGVYYCYRVRVSNAVTESTTNSVCKMTPLATPAAPTLAASATSITVTWQDNVVKETNWLISYARKSGGRISSWTPVPVTVAAGTGTRTYEIKNLASDTQYCVKLSVVKMLSHSSESTVTCKTTLGQAKLTITHASETFDSLFYRRATVTFTVCNLGTAAGSGSLSVHAKSPDYQAYGEWYRGAEKTFPPQSISNLVAGGCATAAVQWDLPIPSNTATFSAHIGNSSLSHVVRIP